MSGSRVAKLPRGYRYVTPDILFLTVREAVEVIMEYKYPMEVFVDVFNEDSVKLLLDNDITVRRIFG